MVAELPDSLSKDSLRTMVLDLLAEVRILRDANVALTARVAELEARLAQPPKTPDNSSLPPSSGQKGNVANTGGKRRKGRKGRPGVARDLCANPDVVRDIHADRCGCGAKIPASGQTLAHAYDHIDLPPIRPVTTRINLHRGQCPCCNRRVTATPPVNMAPGSPFGPGVVAIAAYLHGCQMIGYNRLVEVFGGLFGLQLSEGAIANMLKRAARPFAAEGARIAGIVRASPVIASDETTARINGKTHWQWVFGAATAVSHVIAPTRGKAAPEAFLAGAKPDVWISDRLAAQGRHGLAHQVCLAHLIRDAQYAIDAGDTVFAPGFKAFLQRACAIGRRRANLTDATMAAYARKLRRERDALLDLEPTNRQGNHLRAAMFVDCRERLLVFMTRRDVEPTNNASERELRPSVIFRKVTNGFRSNWGAKAHADLRSIVATARLTGISALAAVRSVLAPARASGLADP